MAEPDSAVEPPEPDPSFEPTERLYRRIPLKDVEAGAVSDASIPAPAFSVDRGKYRIEPAEMLANYPSDGVAAFYVRDIPLAITSDDGRRYDFGVEHRPQTDNYAHSEVHTYHGGERMADIEKDPPRQVRKKFRDLLRRGIVIVNLTANAEGGASPEPDQPHCS
jgi:hypothetical protein